MSSNTTDKSRIEELRAKIEQRKACEKRALDTSLTLIETDKVTTETLITSANLIDQERYRGVNEDRALRNICGYPLCSNSLPNDAPIHQYYINVKVNKVIDTTERRFFCSVFCYKASKYFEKQIPSSPVWAREQEKAVQIDLLTPESLNKALPDTSTIISQSNYNRSIPQRRVSTSSSSSDDDEFQELQSARDAYYRSRAARLPKTDFVEQKLQQISLPDCIRTNNPTIDFVITCLSEWLSNKSKDYLENNTTPSAMPIDPQRYQQLVNKLDVEDLMSSENKRAERKLPTLEQLQKTTTQSQYEIKVKEFFFGKNEQIDEEMSASSAIALPPVDAYSQQSIRLSIVGDKLMTCLKQILSESTHQAVAQDIRTILSEFLLTLNFNSENITLKPNEWTIMTIFLLHLLTIKLPTLMPRLIESKIIKSLLTTLNLSNDTVFQTGKYLLTNPIDKIPSTNFEEID
ncbi:unnamed protein product [Adineta ricciae]|uniref:RNA polymerase II subunit B1 CTD phosphatase RPAP2 homolog n=1 Tax=Adineta ricciae TaxID=249248 RepID=A0A815HSS8_ADIRI|nr:unnamed protein product [Adineta ricciae]